MDQVLCVGLLGCHETSKLHAELADYKFSGAFHGLLHVYSLNGIWSDEHAKILADYAGVKKEPEKPKFNVQWENETPLKKWGICLCLIPQCLEYNGYVFPMDVVNAPMEIEIDNQKYAFQRMLETDRFVVYVDNPENFKGLSIDDMYNHLFEIIAKQQGM